jgi:Cytochrome P450
LPREAGSDSVRDIYTDRLTLKYELTFLSIHNLLPQTALTIIAFFRILVLYPEVQKRAQKELDAVTGGLRLPDYNDRLRLPYIDALTKEVMRWSMATPVGW